MARGIIYLMTSAVSGLIKIGKTETANFSNRMNHLEQNGYRNVTGLARLFAIEVDDYDEKEALLHTIFAKSQLGTAELFALNPNVAIQLLSSFEGKVIYPESETKNKIFDNASEMIESSLIPDGKYFFRRKSKLENKLIDVKVEIRDGEWIIKKGSILATKKGKGGAARADDIRETLKINSNGRLLADANIGSCAPSLAGNVVMWMAISGWTYWRDKQGEPVDIYRKQAKNV